MQPVSRSVWHFLDTFPPGKLSNAVMKGPETKNIDIDFIASKGLSDFLQDLNISLAITTYQSGNIFFIGPDRDDRLSVCPIMHERPMGIGVRGNSIFVAGKNQIWRFNNILPVDKTHQGYDTFFVPQQGWTTGDLDIHDVCIEDDGRVLFVNTLYSCICALAENCSYSIVWKPSWITELAPEDRCHINGLCLKDGQAAYVTAFSETDQKESWRKSKNQSGVVLSLAQNEIVCRNLSMPHSPRWYDGNLWLLESGTGTLGHLDLNSSAFIPKTKIPGYLRGMTFYGDYAFVGSSLPRDNSGISGSPLEQELATKDALLQCGIFIVNMRTFQVAAYIKICGDIQELYDIAILQNCIRPGALGLNSEDINYILNPRYAS